MNTQPNLQLVKDQRLDQLDRASLELDAAAGIVELVRYSIEAEAWREEAEARLERHAERTDNPKPGEFDPHSISAALYDVFWKIKDAKRVLDGTGNV